MSDLKNMISSYHKLSFSDRIVFYTTVSNDISPSDDLQSFLIETRFGGRDHCIYCEGSHVVKNDELVNSHYSCKPLCSIISAEVIFPLLLSHRRQKK